MITPMRTTTVAACVSLRLGQCTFLSSAQHSSRNSRERVTGCLSDSRAFMASGRGSGRFGSGSPGAQAHDRIRTGDLFLTKEVLCRLSYVGERETGIEPATPSLEGSRSAT